MRTFFTLVFTLSLLQSYSLKAQEACFLATPLCFDTNPNDVDLVAKLDTTLTGVTNFGCLTPQRGKWFFFTADTTGLVSLRYYTSNTLQKVNLAVWESDSPILIYDLCENGSYAPIACESDNQQSNTLSFGAVEGRFYLLFFEAVNRPRNQSETLTILLDPPSGVIPACFSGGGGTNSTPCGNATDEPPGCVLCGPVYSGSTDRYTQGLPGPFFPCGSVENNLWLSFAAGSSNLSVTVVATDCVNDQGLQLLVYDQNLTPVSTCFSSGGLNIPGYVSASGLTPGEIYWIMVDGFAGDICEFVISVVGGFHTTSPPDPTAPLTQVPDLGGPLCPGPQFCYFIPPVNGATDYEWLLPSNARIVSGGNGSPNICVVYEKEGAGVVCVIPSNQCFPGVPSCKSVLVIADPPTIRPLIWVCPEDFPLPGTRDTIYKNRYGCDSIVTYLFAEYPQVPGRLDKTICSCDSFSFGGQSFSQPGIHEAYLENASVHGCDSLVLLRLSVVEAEAWIIKSGDFDCTGPAVITLDGSSSGSGVTYSWHSPSGNSINPPFDQATVTVNEPGIYALTITKNEAGLTCSNTATVEVFRQNEPSPPNFISPVTSFCQDNPTPVTYVVNTIDSTINYRWTVPADASFIQDDNIIVVDFSNSTGGDVCVEAISTCGTSQPACVTVAGVSAPTITATITEPIFKPGLSGEVRMDADPLATYLWTDMDGRFIANQSSIVAPPGVYCVEVTNAVGCTVDSCLTISDGLFEKDLFKLICQGERTQLQIEPPTGAIFNWSPAAGLSCTACAEPVANPSVSTKYIVTAQLPDGRTASSVAWVIVLPRLFCNAATGTPIVKILDNLDLSKIRTPEELDKTVQSVLTKEVFIFPNPTTGILNIIVGETTIQKIEIFSLSGNQLYEQDFTESAVNIDLSTFSPATYFLKIQTENAVHFQRIVVTK